jgi:exopolyphosphatase/guanosine-5'-triphosphate,3'-diphosphate pyrophosphatase
MNASQPPINPSPQSIGVVDIGSNSVRLVVYDGLKRSPIPTFSEKAICELARGLAEDGKLQPENIRLTLDTLERYAALLDHLQVGTVRVIATSAVRVASNGEAFAAQAQRVLGHPVDIIPGEEEARLSALGILSAFPEADGLMGDLGGGSLELADLKPQHLSRTTTLRLGHQYLADLQDSAPDAPDALNEYIFTQLNSTPWLAALKGRTFYAVGGEWRELAKAHMNSKEYPLPLVDHYTVPTAELLPLLQPKALISYYEALKPGSGSKRGCKILVLAARVLETIIELGPPRTICFSTSGVREGILFDMLSPAEQAQDPILSGCQEMVQHHNCAVANLEELFPWVLNVFPRADESFTRLCRAACMLSDISLLESRDFKSRNAFVRILNFPFTGMSHGERIFLAIALYARYAGNIKGEMVQHFAEHLDPDDVEHAKELGLALRLAHSLSAHQYGILSQVELKIAGEQLVLSTPPAVAPFIKGQTVSKRFRTLANAFALDPVILETSQAAS